MGFLDDMSGVIDRGAAAVGRTTKSAQLKMQLSDLAKRRRELAAQLGASLYEATKDDASLREGREPLYEGIASIDRQSDELNTQIQAIESATVNQRIPAIGVTCPQCGSQILKDDLFCSGCGAPADMARAEVARQMANAQAAMMPVVQVSSQSTCPQCGSDIGADDRFCMKCGKPLDSTAEAVL